MKSFIYKDINKYSAGQSICIDDESIYHHLIRVFRSRVSESLKVMDGTGTIAQGQITAINKRELEFKVEVIEKVQDRRKMTLYVGVTKRENFESILKVATECNVFQVVPCITEYSADVYSEKILDRANDQPTERIYKILESAMIQSNNPYYLKIAAPIKLHDLCKLATLPLAWIEPSESFPGTNFKQSAFDSILIGPEGGFSEREKELIYETLSCFNQPGPIMRAETCVVFGLGFLNHLCYNHMSN